MSLHYHHFVKGVLLNCLDRVVDPRTADELGLPYCGTVQAAAYSAYVCAEYAEYREAAAKHRAAVAAGDPEAVAADAEHRAEARAAHGPGVELVDVISGHRWVT